MPRDFGNAEIGGLDLASELLKNGWAKLKENKREPTEEDTRKRDLENEAKSSGKGLWNPHGQQVCTNLLFLNRVAHYTDSGACCTSHDANEFAGIRDGMEGKTH